MKQKLWTSTNESRRSLAEHPIVLFMKGTPQFPMCGFSSRAAQALREGGATFQTVNVLADPQCARHLPHFANWPTFPQLFIQGELIGGCDIVEDLKASGELTRMASDVAGGVTHELMAFEPIAGKSWNASGPPLKVAWFWSPVLRWTRQCRRARSITRRCHGGADRQAQAPAGTTLRRDGERRFGGTGDCIRWTWKSATPREYEPPWPKGSSAIWDGSMASCMPRQVSPASRPIAMHKPDDWLRALHVNVSAPFALTQACLPLLTQAPDSAVVFVLDNPDLLQRAHWGAYGVSKAALERFVSILHEEHDTGAFRVHALLPAPMRTALRRRRISAKTPCSNRCRMPPLMQPSIC
jgi:Grx4 family monothiol glutaredoxin